MPQMNEHLPICWLRLLPLIDLVSYFNLMPLPHHDRYIEHSFVVPYTPL